MLHPLLLFCFQISLCAISIGFSPPYSLFRYATLPVVTLFMWQILQTAMTYMIRPPWAGLLGGYSVSFLFQYLDAGVLRPWSFESNGPARIRKDDGKIIKSALVREGRTDPAKSTSWVRRLAFGASTMTSFRRIGTPYQVKGTPQFSETNAIYVPTRSRFIAGCAIDFLVCYLVLDFFYSSADPAAAAAYLSTENVPVLRRFRALSLQELAVRFTASIGFWVLVYCVQRLLYSVVALLSVGWGSSRPEDWPPYFGSPFESYSIRRFWG